MDEWEAERMSQDDVHSAQLVKEPCCPSDLETSQAIRSVAAGQPVTNG
jgi:hypothetical protein